MDQKLAGPLDEYSKSCHLDQLVLGARRGGQIHDIITAVTQTLEVGRDRMDRAAVAIADVKAHHDSVMYGSLFV